jgi:hypothetical protein
MEGYRKGASCQRLIKLLSQCDGKTFKIRLRFCMPINNLTVDQTGTINIWWPVNRHVSNSLEIAWAVLKVGAAAAIAEELSLPLRRDA